MEQIWDMIITGAGPAGLTAAIYAKRAGMKVLLVEESFIKGGQIINTYEVDNYPGLPGISGTDLADRMREHMEKMGVETVRAKVLCVENGKEWKTVHTRKQDFFAKTVVLATGAAHRKLGVPGEEEFSGAGVSYCATCDGAFFRDRTVAVVGGGDVAVEDAIFLAGMCRKVYLIHRRDELRAAKILQEALGRMENVEYCWNRTVRAIEGDGQVQGLLLKDVKSGEEGQIAVDGVFIAVGIVPETGYAADLVARDAGGYIIAGEDGKTSVPGVFAAGDIRTKQLRQVITAAADGANCVESAREYLNRLLAGQAE